MSLQYLQVLSRLVVTSHICPKSVCVYPGSQQLGTDMFVCSGLETHEHQQRSVLPFVDNTVHLGQYYLKILSTWPFTHPSLGLGIQCSDRVFFYHVFGPGFKFQHYIYICKLHLIKRSFSNSHILCHYQKRLFITQFDHLEIYSENAGHSRLIPLAFFFFTHMIIQSTPWQLR